MKLDILAIGAHPDDVELGAGASIAKEIDKGAKVGIVDLTKGELGTRGNPDLRKIEADNSAKILGIDYRYNLDIGDGFFEINKENLVKLIEIIRYHKPEIVLINSIKDRHPDHKRANEFASRACFLSGLKKIKTIYKAKKQDKWRPSQVFSYIQWEFIQPDFVVDVSDYFDRKMEAVMAYKSQFYDENSTEDTTPISTPEFLDSLKNISQELGRLSGVKYAEGFNSEKIPAVDSLFNIK
jgi:N-acetylglucosamine malate deacetylase 1